MGIDDLILLDIKKEIVKNNEELTELLKEILAELKSNKEQKLQTKLLNEMLEQLKLIKGEFRRVGGIRVSKVF